VKLAFELVNFLLLVSLFIWLYRRYRLGRFLEGYRRRVVEEIGGARDGEAEAERLRAQAEEELAAASTRARQVQENARMAGERMLEEHRKAARAEAERLLAQARQEAGLARARLRGELQRVAVEEMVAMAEDILAHELTEADHRGLVQGSLADLEREGVTVRWE
jgi:F-type H+-transporting ATPase subunit b